MAGGGATLGPNGWTCNEITPDPPRVNGHGVPYVLAQSSAPSAVTGTTGETTLVTIPIAAGSFVTSGQRLRVSFNATCTNNANAKTFRARLGGTQILQLSSSFTSMSGGRVYFDLVATGAAAQKCLNGVASYGTAAGASVGTSAINMAAAQSLTLTCQLAVGTDTFQIEDYSAEVLNS
ncbi:hypothetical protein [Burkholderia seminalis]|uniref:hypothetical protein n=1 Tax=Burkholderia seminalis TaxID=488731 RepID=UPI0026566369|nr:hypothetical protein [Burkholderia seminalis]MDN7848114.1 hypothetical protein [Burkholderia seminalis]